MKIIGICGGLGSQMFMYSFFLNVKKKCQEEECMIDTTSYQIKEMWNGYELNTIFNISEKDFLIEKDRLNSEKDILYYNKGKSKKVKLNRLYETFSQGEFSIIDKIKWVYQYKILSVFKPLEDVYPNNYLENVGITYYDEFCHNSDKYILKDKEELKSVFTFPCFTNKKNIQISKKMQESESVAIHIRRSDHMYDNNKIYDRGYIGKAVNYIKENIANPHFFIFSEDVAWCINNLDKIGINTNVDEYEMIDWNNGKESYRDLQLMTFCKHNILISSSFSWWGYYLSIFPMSEKIVIAPKGLWREVPIHM